MPFKGLISAYDTACECFKNDATFYEWITTASSSKCSGQICVAPIYFEKKYFWYLENVNYDPIQEEKSTWIAKKFGGSIGDKNQDSYVKKYFQLENDEYLITINSKDRPVLLLNPYTNDWFNPMSTRHHTKGWLCLPLFSYKKRHSQNYVLEDQKLNSPHRFYMPPSYDDKPGISLESVIQLQTIQIINGHYLIPLKCMCKNKTPQMKRPFKVSDLGLKIILFHFFKSLPVFDTVFNTSKSQEKEDYILFRDIVNEIIKDTSHD
jgi:hypothetical protein